jgi:group I intron endonuclease
LYNSLKKYGWDNHIKEIVEECTEDQLLERETYWKNYYKVLEIPSLCCRLDGRGGKLGEETRKKLSQSKKGCISPNKGKRYPNSKIKGIAKTKEHRENMSLAHKGKKLSKEHINNFIKSRKDKGRKIICINDNKEFTSIKTASRYYNIKAASIDRIVSGKGTKTKKGLIFKYL